MPSRRKVLAICMDAAEPSLVLDLMARGELPVLAGLHREGSWTEVQSPAHIGGTCVYPTFFTGRQPQDHGVFGGWLWNPAGMSVVPMSTVGLRPFWAPSQHEDITVGVLDVPLAPHLGLARGFEVSEWGAHYQPQGRTSISPPEMATVVRREHPFAAGRLETGTTLHREDPEVLARGCAAGAALRAEVALRLLDRAWPDIALVVFTEIHRAGHDLWHTAEPDNPLFDSRPSDPKRSQPGLIAVYQEVDRQVGRLIDEAGDDTAVVVFSLHGMRASRGIGTALAPALNELGFAQLSRRVTKSPGAVGRAALAAVKCHTPDAFKRFYHRRVPRAYRFRLAKPTMLPPYDWSRTRAFALPTDQHGWVRVNLQGREAEGAVAPRDYDATCDEVHDALTGLRTHDGRPLVRDVERADPSGPPPLLPDLIVHWTGAIYDQPVRIKDPAIEVWPLVPDRTGQHRSEGFLLSRGLEDDSEGPLQNARIHEVLLNAARH